MNERLEEIKKQWESGVVKEKHFNWLLEQAVRTQELESERADWELGHKQLSECVEELEQKVRVDSELFDKQVQQNKRYREAINYVVNTKVNQYASAENILEDIRFVLNEALEHSNE